MYRLRTLEMTIWRATLVIRYFLYVWILLVELYNILMKMASLLFGIWHFSHDSKRWKASLIRVDHRHWRLSFVYRADRADRLDTMFTNQTTMNKRSSITHIHYTVPHMLHQPMMPHHDSIVYVKVLRVIISLTALKFTFFLWPIQLFNACRFPPWTHLKVTSMYTCEIMDQGKPLISQCVVIFCCCIQRRKIQ